MKEQFIKAQEELITEFLDENPEASEAQAYDATADKAYDRMRDRLADQVDHYRQLKKDGML